MEITKLSRESHPDEFAAYDATEPGVFTSGAPGRCGGCGRFLAKTTWTNPGYPPFLIDGVLEPGDKGFTETVYHCTNPDEDSDYDH